MSVTLGSKRKESGIAETARVIVHALIIALVIRTFLFQPFNIPSGSMEETLLVGDYLFVSKFSYGYSHYSLPLSPPLFSGRIWSGSPQRGDVVVFRLPKDDSVDYDSDQTLARDASERSDLHHPRAGRKRRQRQYPGV